VPHTPPRRLPGNPADPGPTTGLLYLTIYKLPPGDLLPAYGQEKTHTGHGLLPPIYRGIGLVTRRSLTNSLRRFGRLRPMQQRLHRSPPPCRTILRWCRIEWFAGLAAPSIWRARTRTLTEDAYATTAHAAYARSAFERACWAGTRRGTGEQAGCSRLSTCNMLFSYKHRRWLFAGAGWFRTHGTALRAHWARRRRATAG